MTKCLTLATNHKGPSGCTSVQSAFVYGTMKQMARRVTMPSVSSPGLKEKQQKKFPDEHLDRNSSDQGEPASGDDRAKHMSSKLVSMLGDRVMQLKLHRLPSDSAYEAMQNRGRLSPSNPRAQHTSGTLADRPIKPKTSSVSSSANSSSVKGSSGSVQQRKRRIIGYKITRWRVNVSKKCNMIRRRRAVMPGPDSLMKYNSVVKEVANATASPATASLALDQWTGGSTACRKLGDVQSASVSRQALPKEFSAVLPSNHGNSLVDSDNKSLLAVPEPAVPLNSHQEVCCPLNGHTGLTENFSGSQRSRRDTEIHPTPATAAEDGTAFAKHVKVTSDSSFTVEDADGETSQPFPQHLARRENKVDPKGSRLGLSKRRVGRPRKHVDSKATSSVGTASPAVVRESPALQRPSSQRLFRRRNQHEIKGGIGLLKRRVGRPRKHADPEAISSEDTAHPTKALESPVAQEEYSPQHGQGDLIENSNRSQRSDRGTDIYPTTVAAADDAAVSLEPEEVVRDGSSTAKLAGDKTSQSLSQQLAWRKNQTEVNDNRPDHSVRRVVRSRRHADPDTTLLESTARASRALEPPVAPEVCSPQHRRGSLMESSSRSQRSGRDTDIHPTPVTAAEDGAAFVKHAEVTSDSSHADGRTSQPSSRQRARQKSQVDLEDNRLGLLKRRVGRPRKHVGSEATSEGTASPTGVSESVAVQRPLSQQLARRKNQAKVRGGFGLPKRRVGRPRKHADAETTSSEITAHGTRVLGTPVAQEECSPQHGHGGLIENSSRSQKSDRNADMPVTSAEGQAVAPEHEEVTRDSSLPAKAADGKTSHAFCRKLARRKTQADLKASRSGLRKRRVGRPRKPSDPEASSEVMTHGTKGLETPVAQEECSPQHGHGGLIENSNRSQMSDRDTGMPLTLAEDHAVPLEHERVIRDSSSTAKLASGKTCQSLSQHLARRKNQAEVNDNRPDHSMRRVGRSRKHADPDTEPPVAPEVCSPQHRHVGLIDNSSRSQKSDLDTDMPVTSAEDQAVSPEHEEVTRDSSLPAKAGDGKTSHPFSQKPARRKTQAEMKGNGSGILKRRVGRPRKYSDPETTSSEVTSHRNRVLETPVAQEECSPQHGHGGPTENFIRSQRSDRDADMPVSSAEDQVVPLEHEEVTRDSSLPAKAADGKTSHQFSQKLARQKTEAELKASRSGLKRRVGRPRKHADPETTPSEVTVHGTRVLETPVAQEECSPQPGHGGLTENSNRSQRSDRDADMSVTSAEDQAVSLVRGEVTRDSSLLGKGADVKAPHQFSRELTGRKDQADPKGNRPDHSTRRVRRPQTYLGPEATSSEGTARRTKVVEPPVLQQPFSQRLTRRKNQAEAEDGRPGFPKRRVGRPRKRAGLGAISSEGTGRQTRAHKQLATQDLSSHANSLQAEVKEHVNIEVAQVKDICQGKDLPATQSNEGHCVLPEQGANVNTFPLKTEVMAVIYPCEALSAHLHNPEVAKEQCLQNEMKEISLDVGFSSSIDQPIIQEVHGAQCSSVAYQSLLRKRQPGRPKKKLNGARSAERDQSDSASVTEVSSVSSHEQVVPQDVVDPRAVRTGMRTPGRPRKRRRGANSSLADLALLAEQTSTDSNHDQVVPEQPDEPRKTRRQASQQSEELTISGPEQKRDNGSSGCYASHCPQQEETNEICLSSVHLPAQLGGKPIQPKNVAEGESVPVIQSEKVSPVPVETGLGHDVRTLPPGQQRSRVKNVDKSDQKRLNDHGVTRRGEKEICPEGQKTLPTEPEKRRSQPGKRTSGRSFSAIQNDRVFPTSVAPDFAHVVGALQPGQKRRCRVKNGDDGVEKRPQDHDINRGAEETCPEGREKTEVHHKVAADIECKTTLSPGEISPQPSQGVLPSSEQKGKYTADHQGEVPTDVGSKSVTSGQGAIGPGGRILQVKLLPLAVALGLELASRNYRSATVTSTSPSERQSPPAKQDTQELPPEPTAKEAVLNQPPVTEKWGTAPSCERLGEEPSWMGRSSSPTSDFDGFTRKDVFSQHPVDSEVISPKTVTKNCREDGGSNKLQDPAPLAAAAAVPSTPSTTGDIKRHRCEYCSFESPLRKRFEDHVRRRHWYLVAKRKHVCDKCPYSSNHMSALKRHYMKHTGEKPFPCPVCGKRFIRNTAVKAHMLTHTDAKPFVCETCGRGFRTAAHLRYHQRVHTEEKPFRCDLCDKRFRARDKLDIHILKHTGERPFQCAQCGKRLQTKTSLQNHMRIHTGEKPYRCDICGKAFPIRSNLIDHSYTHTNERNFKCDICQKAFKAKKFLDCHMKIHTGKKRFECRFCGKKFLRLCALDIHARIHTGERPFSCDICGKSFAVKKLLKDHNRVHTGEKPFKCETCKMVFRYTSSLRCHIRHFHEDVKRKNTPVPA